MLGLSYEVKSGERETGNFYGRLWVYIYIPDLFSKDDLDSLTLKMGVVASVAAHLSGNILIPITATQDSLHSLVAMIRGITYLPC